MRTLIDLTGQKFGRLAAASAMASACSAIDSA